MYSTYDSDVRALLAGLFSVEGFLLFCCLVLSELFDTSGSFGVPHDFFSLGEQ